MTNRKNLISHRELVVLKCLSEKFEIEQSDSTPLIEITDIASGTGIRDSDEVLRTLYTLEGKQLVEPFPVGDFTSNRWQITQAGVKALQILVPA